MRDNIFKHIFKDYQYTQVHTQVHTQSNETKYHNLKVVYKLVINNLTELDQLFGQEWYFLFSKTNVACHCAPITISTSGVYSH